MTEITTITDEVILQDSINKLTRLYEEDRVAANEKEKRDAKIARAKAVYELYSGKPYSVATLLHDGGTVISYDDNYTDSVGNDLKFDYPAGTWKDKLIAIFKFENRVLRVRDIVEIVQVYQKDYTYEQLVGLISNTINTNLVKNGILKVYKPEVKTKGFYYGNPLWWDGDTLKETHKPKENVKKVW